MTADNGLSADRAPDSMVLHDGFEPGIKAGSYRFVLQQTVELDAGQKHHYYRDQRFVVQGPRYLVASDEIQAFFPPAGGVGDYQNILPHVVLRKRALPWEWSVGGGDVEGKEGERAPWLALLVLTHEEFEAAGGDSLLHSVTPAELHNQGDGLTLLPKLYGEGEEQDTETKIRVLDLPVELFLKLCPKKEELAYLAHVRCVDTSNKVLQQMHAEGEFSVLVANRFPGEGANIVHLVSLEGWGSLIESGPDARPKADRVRLITLASWSFVNDAAGVHTFGDLMKELDVGSLAVKLDPPSGNRYVDTAVERGYVPVEYRPRYSSQTFAWYRGPFTPLPTASLEGAGEPFHQADAALIFDENTSLMDVSYAAAWQLGRLLALASPAFASGLRTFVHDHHDAFDAAERIESWLETHRSAVRDQRESEGDRTGTPGPDQGQAKTLTAITDELVDWLARLALLYPVPFDYLVADERLLPPESLRFFYIDNNWAEALVEGALSIGIHCARDREATTRSDLRAALSRMVSQYRRHRQGKKPAAEPPDTFMDHRKTGFLLRSEVVSGWPGVEVQVVSDAQEDPALPAVLRLDHLSAGVLLCIVPGTIKKVVFKEPREGLRFGVDENDRLVLRDIQADVGASIPTDAGHTSYEVGPDGQLRVKGAGDEVAELQKLYNVKGALTRADAAPGVIDVQGLVDALAEALTGKRAGEAGFGSAALALQMMRAPEEQTIKWTHGDGK